MVLSGTVVTGADDGLSSRLHPAPSRTRGQLYAGSARAVDAHRRVFPLHAGGRPRDDGRYRDAHRDARDAGRRVFWPRPPRASAAPEILRAVNVDAIYAVLRVISGGRGRGHFCVRELGQGERRDVALGHPARAIPSTRPTNTGASSSGRLSASPRRSPKNRDARHYCLPLTHGPHVKVTSRWSLAAVRRACRFRSGTSTTAAASSGGHPASALVALLQAKVRPGRGGPRDDPFRGGRRSGSPPRPVGRGDGPRNARGAAPSGLPSRHCFAAGALAGRGEAIEPAGTLKWTPRPSVRASHGTPPFGPTKAWHRRWPRRRYNPAP